MIFRRLAGAFGVGGPSVETVLHAPRVRPGEYLAGEVHVQGGDHDVHIHGVVLSLVTQVEYEGEEYEGETSKEFHRGAITGPFHLGAGQHHTIPFQLPIPWELPITEVYGQHLPGMTMGVRTELEVAGAVDKSDLDPIAIQPLPSQQRVLDAFAALGFQFKSADLEEGHISGIHQELPFYQEIEFYPPGEYHGRINEVELTFVANPGGLAVILEADKQGGFFSEGGDVIGRFHVDHGQALHYPWESQLSGWLQAIVGHLHGGYGHDPYGSHGVPGVHGVPGGPGVYGGHDVHGGHGVPGSHGVHGGYGHPGSHGGYEHGSHGGYGHHESEEHRSGPGWGTVAAAGAAGLVGGVAVGMVASEIFDGDDEEEEREEALEEAIEEAQFQAQVDAATDQAYAEAYEDAYEEASWDEE